MVAGVVVQPNVIEHIHLFGGRIDIGHQASAGAIGIGHQLGAVAGHRIQLVHRRQIMKRCLIIRANQAGHIVRLPQKFLPRCRGSRLMQSGINLLIASAHAVADIHLAKQKIHRTAQQRKQRNHHKPRHAGIGRQIFAQQNTQGKPRHQQHMQ